MDQNYNMNGKVDVSLFGVTIPGQFISDEGVTTTATETVREIPTMAGTFRTNTNIYEEANAVFNIVLPNLDFLKNVLPDLYQAGTGRRPGRIAIGGDVCTARENTPLVIHYSCQEDSDNDVYLPNASIVASFELTQNASDPVTIAITANAQPELETGVLMYLGAGSLTQDTLWNPVTGEYEVVTS